jgi:hypothetical protein
VQISESTGSPTLFTAPCALNTKSFNRSKSVNEFEVADCAEPDDPVWVERVTSALTAGVSGSGTLAKESLDLYEDFYASVDSRPVRIVLDYAVGPRTYEGNFHLSSLNITGELGALITVELELVSDGPVVPITP